MKISKNMFVGKEIASSLIISLFGLGFLLYDLKYPLEQWANPGPGVFPLMVGALLVILAVWQLIQEVRRPRSEETKESHEGIGSPTGGFVQRMRGETKPLLLIVLFIGYLLMIKWVGFFTSNFFFVVISSRLIGAKSWGKPIALSAGVSFFCYFLFEFWLKLSFPRGVLF